MNPEWDEGAYDALADVWVLATPEERDLIEAAVNRVNVLLQDRPHEQGESRFGDVRVVIVGRLTVYFRAVPGSLARVLHVRWFRRRPAP